MKKKTLLLTVAIFIIAFSSVAQETGTFTDSRDEKDYKTVKIGTQTWMAENLSYKASSDCWAYINDESFVSIYGYLYSWEAAKAACPSGWHLPSDEEWSTLINYLGGVKVAGGKLKSTSDFQSPNTGATNESGFTALPGGYRYDEKTYDKIGEIGGWWSSTESYPCCAWRLNVVNAGSGVSRSDNGKDLGFSVRCIKD
jgi:uncharacterized protein (TIGR02145 family)